MEITTEQWIAIGTVIALAVSEILSALKVVKSNAIHQLVINVAKTLKEKASKKPVEKKTIDE